jgi:hypothetical protein
MCPTEFEEQTVAEDGLLKKKISDGRFTKFLMDYVSEDSSEEIAKKTLENALPSLDYFVDPSFDGKKKEKILCVGKVQSGKTGFFIMDIALAFDNGYSVAYVIGGTKTNLKDQSLGRIQASFANNKRNVTVVDINFTKPADVKNYLSSGKKVIVVVLKQSNKTTPGSNLKRLSQFAASIGNIPSLIIDDESDEVSPGRVKKDGTNSGAAHGDLTDLLDNFEKVTFLEVTATPAADLLLSTIADGDISPDHCVLVRPGEGYTGGNAFHDSMLNKHVIEAEDTADFETSAPKTFDDCLYYFLIACAIVYIRGSAKPYSMLVHPSMNTEVHESVADVVRSKLNSIIKHLSDSSDLYYSDYVQALKTVFEDQEELIENPPSFDKILDAVKENLRDTGVQIVNGNQDPEQVKQFENNIDYRIYVGGNMLQRGMTIDNLIVTYIYRVAKKDNAADTMQQRARWFGYKSSYLDLCRVFMPKDMKQKYIDITDSENDTWAKLEAFNKTGRPLQEFERIFKLAGDGLILTRKSVSKTIPVGFLTNRYMYDKSIDFLGDDADFDNKLIEGYLADKPFVTVVRGNQVHHRYEISMRDFFEKVLKLYRFPQMIHVLNLYTFQLYLEHVDDGSAPDQILFYDLRVVNREKDNSPIYFGQFRQPSSDKRVIDSDLPQSYHTKGGVKVDGDKNIEGNSGNVFLSLHHVFIDDDHKPTTVFGTMPLFAFNNPLLDDNVKKECLVTGSNQYGSNK